MVKLYSIAVLRNETKPAHELCHGSDLSSFPWLARSSAQEFMTFTSCTVAEATKAGTRQSIEERGQKFHIYARTEGICGVIIADGDYPPRVAFTLLNKVLDEFLAKHAKSKWATGTPKLPMPELDTYIAKYQDPKQADTIMRVQQELDETKIVLHKTIDSVLQRGTKLEDLAQRSDQLSMQSKLFAKQAKAQNNCC